MGIIAGIAVPVTISVINRQRKNAAAKSAEAVVATIKQYVNEMVGEATGDTITVSLTYGSAATSTAAASTSSKPTAMTIGGTAATNYEDFLVENLKATGTISATYTIANATYEYTLTNFEVNGYEISYDANTGKWSAA